MDSRIRPFTLDVPQAALDDLARRLAATRWPEKEPVDDWSQGAPLAHVQALCEHWRTRYDWRRCEAMLNGFGLFKTEIDGVEICFVHKRSPRADALPLIITHGWPGSIIEFHKVIGPLSDPEAHGGSADDAFHVVAPCLPGYGFSGKPATTGWGVPKIAQAWVELMRRLGYHRFVAQGGDWGSAVTSAIALTGAPELMGIHLNMVLAFPAPEDMESLTEQEKAAIASFERYNTWGNGYSQQQATRPQTLGYGLADSPVGQAAWIYEKFFKWTDCNGDPRNALGLDEMLDNIMLYWLTDSGASSARLYWESFRSFPLDAIEVPVGCSLFPKEIFSASRRWAERRYKRLVHWNELERGGHFAAFEQPELFVAELRAAFRAIKAAA
jgi:pimeloyl-ACP methyl ester carboxylesterase